MCRANNVLLLCRSLGSLRPASSGVALGRCRSEAVASTRRSLPAGSIRNHPACYLVVISRSITAHRDLKLLHSGAERKRICSLRLRHPGHCCQLRFRQIAGIIVIFRSLGHLPALLVAVPRSRVGYSAEREEADADKDHYQHRKPYASG